MIDDPVMTLVRRGADPMSGVYLNTGCNEDAVRQVLDAAKQHLGEELPDGYVRLLRATNGVQINGVYFKTAENLVPENLDVLRPEVVVLGTDGVAEYVFDRRDRRFNVINMGFPNERFESFETFEELLRAVLRAQQVV